MAKSMKRMVCVFLAAALAMLPLSAWADMTGKITKTNENAVEVYGVDLVGEHSVQVDLKIVDDAGKAIPGASFRFSSVAQGNVVYQSPYNNQTGLMTVIVSNGENELNGVGAGDYDIGTLNVPVTTDERAFVTMQGVTSSNAVFRLQPVNPVGGIDTIELNPSGDNPPTPGTKTDITSATVTGLMPEYSYNNGAVIPIDFDVVLGSKTLTPGTDYTSQIKNSSGNTVTSVTNSGNYTLTITGTGDYEGTLTRTFKVMDNVTPGTVDIGKDASISGIDATYEYTGNPIDLSGIVVKDSTGKTLVRGTDYEIRILDKDGNVVSTPLAAGDYYVIIDGKAPNYSGSSTPQKITIAENGQPNPPVDVDIKANGIITGLQFRYTYNNGNDIPIEFKLMVNGRELVNGTDYRYYFTNDQGQNVDRVSAIGSYKLMIEALDGSGYVGTKDASFEVVDNADPDKIVLNSKNTEISGFSEYYTYTGSAIKFPSFTVKYGDVTLREGIDYDVSYITKDGKVVENPTAIGDYYLVIDGKGAYSGSVSKVFKIVQSQGGGQNDQKVSGDPKTNPKLSQTGDSMTTVVGICLAVAAVAALILAIVAFRRSKAKKTR